jgi:hypothetical protein
MTEWKQILLQREIVILMFPFKLKALLTTVNRQLALSEHIQVPRSVDATPVKPKIGHGMKKCQEKTHCRWRGICLGLQNVFGFTECVWVYRMCFHLRETEHGTLHVNDESRGKKLK